MNFIIVVFEKYLTSESDAIAMNSSTFKPNNDITIFDFLSNDNLVKIDLANDGGGQIEA